MPKVPIPLPPELEAAASAVLDENAKAPAPAPEPDARIEPVRVGPLTFREPTFGDVEALRLLGSPYYARFVSSAESVEPDLGALLDVVFLWTRPALEGLALAVKGAAEFRRASSSAVDLVDAPITVSRALNAAVEAIIRRLCMAERPGMTNGSSAIRMGRHPRGSGALLAAAAAGGGRCSGPGWC